MKKARYGSIQYWLQYVWGLFVDFGTYILIVAAVAAGLFGLLMMLISTKVPH
jgi:hypothetical protein